MRGNSSVAVMALGIAVFVAAAAVTPFFSHPAYSSLSNTVSELAGQNMPNAWAMRTGFVAFGAATVIVSITRLRVSPAVSAALVVFGSAMIAAALWSNMPIDPVLGGSRDEDFLHSVAASTMGGAFAVACAARIWTRWQMRVEWLSLVGLAASVLIPLTMINVPGIAGGVQRLMFLISFIWILDELRR